MGWNSSSTPGHQIVAGENISLTDYNARLAFQ